MLRDLHKLWPAMNWSAVDETFPLWVTAVAALVAKHRSTSSNLAAGYVRALRYAEGITDTPPIVVADPVPLEQLETSLTVTAAVAIKGAAAQGVVRDKAMANAFVRSSGAVTRMVLAGGRETIRNTVKADPAAKGWRRVIGANSCEFCSMLASRGGAYKADTADFRAHDHCGCSVEPVYR